jgi:hypothetical protein
MSSDLPRSEVTGWIGWISFAGYFMIIVGFFGVLQGLAALLRDESYFVVTKDGLLTFDYTAWGWIHLIMGVVLVLVGAYLVNGAAWARVVAIIFIGLHMIAQFAFLAAFPVWGVIAIALDAIVLYALLVHGREMSDL